MATHDARVLREDVDLDDPRARRHLLLVARRRRTKAHLDKPLAQLDPRCAATLRVGDQPVGRLVIRHPVVLALTLAWPVVVAPRAGCQARGLAREHGRCQPRRRSRERRRLLGRAGLLDFVEVGRWDPPLPSIHRRSPPVARLAPLQDGDHAALPEGQLRVVLRREGVCRSHRLPTRVGHGRGAVPSRHHHEDVVCGGVCFLWKCGKGGSRLVLRACTHHPASGRSAGVYQSTWPRPHLRACLGLPHRTDIASLRLDRPHHTPRGCAVRLLRCRLSYLRRSCRPSRRPSPRAPSSPTPTTTAPSSRWSTSPPETSRPAAVHARSDPPAQSASSLAPPAT